MDAPDPTRGLDDALSAPHTKKGRTQRLALEHLLDHERGGELPTTGRFVFYEVAQRGDARKPSPDDARPNTRRSIGWPPGSQDLTDALTHLRDVGLIPWGWLVDTERSVAVFAHAPTVAGYLRDRLAEATINPWGGPPPLILCEDRGTAEVLHAVAGEFACPIAGTKGHANGFLRTAIAPLLEGTDRAVLYLGDLDRSGGDIEANSLRVLEDAAPDWSGDWQRIALTAEQVDDAEPPIAPIYKVDGRDGEVREAFELQALGQGALVALVRDTLTERLPEPLARVHEREEAEREVVARLLDTLVDGEAGR